MVINVKLTSTLGKVMLSGGRQGASGGDSAGGATVASCSCNSSPLANLSHSAKFTLCPQHCPKLHQNVTVLPRSFLFHQALVSPVSPQFHRCYKFHSSRLTFSSKYCTCIFSLSPVVSTWTTFHICEENNVSPVSPPLSEFRLFFPSRFVNSL